MSEVSHSSPINVTSADGGEPLRFAFVAQWPAAAESERSILCLDGCMAGTSREQARVERVEVVELIDGAGNSPETFLRAVRLLGEMAARYAPVLVHCHAGRSRSATVIASISCRRQHFAEAMGRITSKRRVAIMAGLQEALDLDERIIEQTGWRQRRITAPVCNRTSLARACLSRAFVRPTPYVLHRRKRPVLPRRQPAQPVPAGLESRRLVLATCTKLRNESELRTSVNCHAEHPKSSLAWDSKTG